MTFGLLALAAGFALAGPLGALVRPAVSVAPPPSRVDDAVALIVPEYWPVGEDAALKVAGAAGVNQHNAEARARLLEGALDHEVARLEAARNRRQLATARAPRRAPQDQTRGNARAWLQARSSRLHPSYGEP